MPDFFGIFKSLKLRAVSKTLFALLLLGAANTAFAHAPKINLTTPDSTPLVCNGDSLCISIQATDTDAGNSITITKTGGAGSFSSVTGLSPLNAVHCFRPDSSGCYRFIFKAEDNTGRSSRDTLFLNVTVDVQPKLFVNGQEVAALTGCPEDVLLSFGGSRQTWRILKEITPWDELNRFGYYTDLGTGANRTLLFTGPEGEGTEKNSTLSAGQEVGLWLLNDLNGNGVFDGNDSFLFSQRSLTAGSVQNEHQWFLVFDVRAFKGDSAAYLFDTFTEDLTLSGDFDFLIFVDDDHTGPNFDHNDLVIGVSTASAGQPQLSVIPNRLGFAANFGGPNPNPQAVLISSTGGDISWSAAVSQNWLSLNPASGTANASPSLVDVAVDIDALNPGLYIDTITFSSSQSGVAPVKVPVFLQIFPPSGLSDSVDIIDQTIDLTGQSTRFSVPIFASNTQALLGIILPLYYADGLTTLDSASFAGSRVEFADVKLFLPLQQPNHFLVFIGFIGTPPLPPGQGLIGRLYFTATGAPPGGRDTLIIDSASVPNQSAASMGEMALSASLSVSYIVTTGTNRFILNPAFSKGTVIMHVPTSADDFGGNIPKQFSLGQNYPNPFNPHTAISFALPQPSEVRLDVFDMLGRWVITLMKGQEPAGRHHVIWDGRDKNGRTVSSGMYLYRLKAGGFEETKKMLFLK